MSYTLADLVSPEYRKMLNVMHQNPLWGGGAQRHVPFFIEHLDALGCRTFLDYGCGKGAMLAALSPMRPKLDIRLFDPGNPEVDALPEPADFVAALSCIENIEPDRVDAVLGHICSLAMKGAYLSINTRLGRMNDLPDGRNEHLSVHPAEWWLAALGKYDWSVKDKKITEGKLVQVWIVK